MSVIDVSVEEQVVEELETIPVLPEEPEIDPVVAGLRRVKDLLKGRWTQNTYYDPDTQRMCVIGAVKYGCSSIGMSIFNAEEAKLVEALYKAIPSAPLYQQLTIASKGDYVVSYNDAKFRTEEDMLTLIDRAITLVQGS